MEGSTLVRIFRVGGGGGEGAGGSGTIRRKLCAFGRNVPQCGVSGGVSLLFGAISAVRAANAGAVWSCTGCRVGRHVGWCRLFLACVCLSLPSMLCKGVGIPGWGLPSIKGTTAKAGNREKASWRPLVCDTRRPHDGSRSQHTRCERQNHRVYSTALHTRHAERIASGIVLANHSNSPSLVRTSLTVDC